MATRVERCGTSTLLSVFPFRIRNPHFPFPKQPEHPSLPTSLDWEDLETLRTSNQRSIGSDHQRTLLNMTFTSRHRPISPISLDKPAFRHLVPKHQFQMFTIPLIIRPSENADGQLEDVELRYAGTGVAQGFCWSRVHSQRGNFGDGIPAGGADSYR